MRAEPPISPLTLGLCCAVVAGALALAPGQMTSPVGPGRGADIVALEGDAMNTGQQPPVDGDGPDQGATIDEVEVLGRMTSRTESPEANRGATSCTEDCGGAQAPTGEPTGTASDEVASDRAAGEGRPDPDAPEPDTTEPTEITEAADTTDTTGTDAPTDATTGGSTAGGEHDDDGDSCRSDRAVAARNGGGADVAPPSPCSQGRDHEPCGQSPCDDRSRGTKEV